MEAREEELEYAQDGRYPLPGQGEAVTMGNTPSYGASALPLMFPTACVTRTFNFSREGREILIILHEIPLIPSVGSQLDTNTYISNSD